MEASSWERLWPLLVTALLSLLVLGVVQLVIAPRLEARKRQEDRWESNVLSLGELLTFDMPRAADDAFLHLTVAASFVSDEAFRAGIRDHDAFRRRLTEDAKRSCEEFERIRTRMDWLIGRVMVLDSRAIELARVRALSVAMRRATEPVLLAYRLSGVRALSLNAVETAARQHREDLRALVVVVTALASHGTPTRSAVRWFFRRGGGRS